MQQNSIKNKMKSLKKFTFKTILCALLVFIGLVVFILQCGVSKTYLISYVDKSELITSPSKVSKYEIKSRKTILMWTSYFDESSFLVFNMKTSRCASLPGFPLCKLTFNRLLSTSADAILFHYGNLNSDDLPRKELNSSQIWIYLNHESPAYQNQSVLKRIAPHVNWAITYRDDSDFKSPYGRFKKTLRNIAAPRKSNRTDEETEFRKKKIVAWLVSRCDTRSKREDFVAELKKHVPVDVFGGCGTTATFCYKNERLECYQEMGKRYKFYLSFENAICKDYVTEKFFMALQSGLVPVVLGGADYNKLSPRDSFIDAMDYDSPKALAVYLKTVANNFTLFKRYLGWRNSFEVEFSNVVNHWMCDVCKRLYKNEVPSSKDWYQWWKLKAECHAFNEKHPHDMV